MMRRAALILVGALALALSADAATQRRLIVTSQDHSLVDADDCDHFHTRNTTSLPAQARAEQQWTLRLEAGDVLKVHTGKEGGVSVKGWDRPYGSLTVCKSAVALTQVQARNTLRDVNVTVKNDDIDATGPDHDQNRTWWVHMILRVPRGVHLDVTTANGGIAIRNMTGKILARATNGGISLGGCTGESYLTTENGGISLDKVSGNVAAQSQNGPIALKLRDIVVPAIEANTQSSGAIFCKVKGCEEGGVADWTPDRKRMRIGSANPVIRLTTTSADIMIEQVR